MIDRSRWNVQYYQRVLATDPIGHWMQDEKQGTASYDMVTARSNGARNGAYTGPTLGQPGIGDGRTAPFFDGALDYNDIFTASFSAAFNGDEGSALIWFRVANAGVWADGFARRGITISIDVNNQVHLYKFDPNIFLLLYRAGGVTRQSVIATTTVAWASGLLTWSAAADEVRGYFNGVQNGATLNGLGVWAGAPIAVNTTIGAVNTVPTQVWSGWLAHGVFWDRPLSPAEALSLGVL